MLAALTGVAVVRGQEAPAAQHPGMATGEQHKAVFDEQHRVITAGGFVKTGPWCSRILRRRRG
jgi:hypothetical protein